MRIKRISNRYTKIIKRLLIIGILAFGLVGVFSISYRTATEIAVKNMEDELRLKLNSQISDIMNSGEYRIDDFIKVEKNSSGELSAIISDMTVINELSGKILQKLCESGFDTAIPLGNLTAVKSLAGKGPEIPMKLRVLGSSEVETENSLISPESEGSGFRIFLEITADAEIILPWHREQRQIKTNVIIAEAFVFPKRAAS